MQIIGQSEQPFNSSSTIHWVVVANQTVCDVYEQQLNNKALVKRFTLSNPEGRKKSSELASDKDGRSFDSIGMGRHTMSKEPAAKKQRYIEKFATDICAKLKIEHNAGHFKHLSIIAAPAFMGLLRNAFGNFQVAGNFRTISKDLVTQDEALIHSTLACHRSK